MGSKIKVHSATDERDSWKDLYERQGLFIHSINSLLKRYGRTVELSALHREFLLTIMGQYVVADAFYFSVEHDSYDLAPVLSYGKVSIDELEPLDISQAERAFLQANPKPHRLKPLPEELSSLQMPPQISDVAHLCCPVALKDRLLGLAFLGNSVSGRKYTEFELKVLGTLCGISAVTFNNAHLYENTRISMEEVKRLFDLRTEMIDRVSHEFRTPLTVIRGGLEAVSAVEGLGPIMESVTASVQRLEELITSLLTLNKKYQKGPGGKVNLFNVSAVVHEVLSDHERAAFEKSVTFSVSDALGGAVPEVTIPRAEFKTVVDALIKNAVKFANESTAIEVRVECLSREVDESIDGKILVDWESHTREILREYAEVGGPPDMSPPVDQEHLAPRKARIGPYVVVRVTDSGIGIPAEEIEYLGEPFRQASNAPSRGVKGRGLGLAVAMRILSDGRGTLCCRSTEGKETTFSFFLPLD